MRLIELYLDNGAVAVPGITTRMFMNIGYYVKSRELLPLREEMLKALSILGRGPEQPQ